MMGLTYDPSDMNIGPGEPGSSLVVWAAAL